MAEIIPFDVNHKCHTRNHKSSRKQSIFERITTYFKKKQHKRCMHITTEYKSI